MMQGVQWTTLSLLLMVILSACQRSDSVLVHPTPLPTPQHVKPRIGLSYPPLHTHRDRQRTAFHARQLGVTHIRFDVHWRWLEPEPGKYNWESLDRQLLWARQHNFKVMLTMISDAPDWVHGPRNARACVPEDRTAFSRFVARLAERMPSFVERVQYGNEWQIAYWFPGSAEDFVDLNNRFASAFREHAPQTKIVLGGFSIGALRALAAIEGSHDHVFKSNGTKLTGKDLTKFRSSDYAKRLMHKTEFVLEQADYDELDAHLYHDPHYWSRYIGFLKKRVPDKPVLVTEFGGPDKRFQAKKHRPVSPEEMEQYLKALHHLGVNHAYFFKLRHDKSATHSMTGSYILKQGKTTPAYERLRQWNQSLNVTAEQPSD